MNISKERLERAEQKKLRKEQAIAEENKIPEEEQIKINFGGMTESSRLDLKLRPVLNIHGVC